MTARVSVSPQPDHPTVCIISPHQPLYDETYIRAHIERLPARVTMLYGGTIARLRAGEGRPLFPLAQRGVQYVLRKTLGMNPQPWRNAALARYLQREKVEVVLVEFGPMGVVVMDACRMAGVPFVVHYHAPFAPTKHLTQGAEYAAAYRRMLATADALIAVSREMERQLLALSAPRERLFYNPYGVDTALFSGAAPDTAPPVFIAVARFEERKAPHITLRAFRKVVNACPEARLVMIGEGSGLNACKQLANALALDSHVDFAGRRSHAQVAAALPQARAFIQHSIRRQPDGATEGTPLAVLEAAAAGLPIVSTRNGGIPDVVAEGETGFLVDEGDVEGMAAHMLRLAQDPALAAQLGHRAREKMIREFSMERSIGNLWRILQGTVRAPRADFKNESVRAT